jgi:hypothetical protein
MAPPTPIAAADFLKRECLTWRLPPRECPEIVASATGANCIAFAVRFPAAYLALDPERKHFFIPNEDGSITTAILYLIKNAPGFQSPQSFLSGTPPRP